MPSRIWIWAGMAIAIVALVYVTLNLTRATDNEETASGAAALTGPAIEPPPALPPTPPPATSPQPAAPAPTPELIANAAAFAVARTGALPIVEGRATLKSVVAEGAEITLTYELDINAGTYDLPDDSVPGLSAIAPFACDDAVCFQLADRFVDRPCNDAELLPLLQAGATAVFVYRDMNGAELAAMPVTAAACVP